jgi:4-hydroxybenzoate polyprenyltransferase
MGKRGEEFRNLLKATRAYRVLPTLMIILVSASFANAINNKIIILGLAATIIYSAYGIHNAVRDNDYLLPKYSKKVIIGLLIFSLLISLADKVIFLTSLAAIFLGVAYNTVSRRILFGDTTILAITHYALPSFSASILLGVDKNSALLLSGFMFITFWFLLPVKNLKNVKEDSERGYKTPAMLKHGRTIILVLFGISLLIISSAYFLFDLSSIYLLVLLLIFILGTLVIRDIFREKEISALKIARLIILIFLLGLIIEKTTNLSIISSTLFLFFMYIIFLTANFHKNKSAGREYGRGKNKDQH